MSNRMLSGYLVNKSIFRLTFSATNNIFQKMMMNFPRDSWSQNVLFENGQVEEPGAFT